MDEINGFMTHKTYQDNVYSCKYNFLPVGTVPKLIMSNYIIGHIKMFDIKVNSRHL